MGISAQQPPAPLWLLLHIAWASFACVAYLHHAHLLCMLCLMPPL